MLISSKSNRIFLSTVVLSDIAHQPILLRKVIEASKGSENLLLSIEREFGTFGLGICWDSLTSRGIPNDVLGENEKKEPIHPLNLTKSATYKTFRNSLAQTIAVLLLKFDSLRTTAVVFGTCRELCGSYQLLYTESQFQPLYVAKYGKLC